MAINYPSVGAVTMTAWVKGALDEPGMTVEELSRRGKHGHSYTQAGDRSEPRPIVLFFDAATALAAQTKFRDLKALQGGDPVDIKDGHGLTWPDQMILAVRLAEMEAYAAAVGGTNNGQHGIFVLVVAQSTYLG